MRCLIPVVAAIICTAASAGETYPLRDAVEFSPRNGLPNFFAKLNEGKEVRIAYLGGSITAAPGWRVKTLKWFQEQYPKAKISEINAAIGGTGSDLGVYRVEYDALRHKPDLMFVEFAVNDGGSAPDRIHRGMEGILRQAWKADPAMDVCYVYTVSEVQMPDLRGGKFQRSASAMEALADHYGIPSIHFGVEVVKMEKEGKLVFKATPKTDEEKKALEGKMVFSGDGVHPHVETGHVVYAEAVARSMEKMKAAGKAGAHEAKAPFIADNWEAARMWPLDKAKLSAGFQKQDPAAGGPGKSFSNRMPAIYKVSQAGEKLSFKFKGTAAGIYDVVGPDCGQVKVSLDGAPAKTVARIDGYCTYHRIAVLQIGAGLEDKVHTVEIELDSVVPDKKKILFEQNRADMEKTPKKYEGTNWYAGGLMLIGEVVE